MNDVTASLPVLRNYPVAISADRVCAMGNAGGFSGAKFWKLTTDAGHFCLRRWPAEHPTPERLQMIHSVLLHVHASGFEAIPTPIANRAGGTFTRTDGALWELTQWLPGRADFHHEPTARRAENIMRAMATFHRYAASAITGATRRGPSAGIQERLEQLRELSGPITFPARSPESEALAELQEHAIRWERILQRVGDSIEQELSRAARLSFELQPCIRDIWHDHILLEHEDVTGIVDFGAMRYETVAGDLARLLGSLFEDDLSAWSRAIDCYEAVRSLDENERIAVATFDRSAVLLSPYNWFRWLLVERREFDQMDVILTRIRWQMRRLEKLNQSGSVIGGLDHNSGHCQLH